MVSRGTRNTLLVVLAVVAYVGIDVTMDILLFPLVSPPLQEHHRAVVTRHAAFFGLLPVWIVGTIFFEKRHWKLPALIFASALVATVAFAFTSLPFIAMASAFPGLAGPFLFLHDHGLFVYFGLLVVLLGIRHFAQRAAP